MAGILYMVATPIGNLQDITLRSLETLKSVDIVLAEDTRKTGVLLKKYGIKTRMMTFNHHARNIQYEKVLQMLQDGKSIAFVTDAGTPGVSDPGNLLIDYLYSKATDEDDFLVSPIPGPSALTALISVSGFATDAFTFRGFLPKKGRDGVLTKIAASSEAQIFLESPHRIQKVLIELSSKIGERRVVIGRELTKQFETLYRGSLLAIINGDKKMPTKGEFIVIVEGNKARK